MRRARISIVLILMTTAARADDVSAVGPRFRILGGENVVRAVALAASFGAQGHSVYALVIGTGIVAGLALDRLDNLRVRGFGGIETLVAVDATQRFVGGMLEDVLIDIELDFLPLPLHTHAGLVVARQAVFLGLTSESSLKNQEQN